MADPCVIIKDVIVAASLAGYNAPTAEWQLFIGTEPPVPEKVITIFRSGGGSPNPKWLVDYPSVQIRVRGAIGEYDDAQSKASSVKDALLGLGPYAHTSGDVLVQVNMQGDIFPLPADETGKPIFVVNFNLRVEPASTSLTNRLPL
jgi:hypothetical protein